MRCDLCGETGGVVVVATPDPPAFERRKSGPRREHPKCTDAVAAHRAAEKAKTDRWVDRQFAEFAAARRLVTT